MRQKKPDAIDTLPGNYRHSDDFDEGRSGRGAIGWLAVALVSLVLAVLAFTRPAHGVTQTAWNASTHRAVLIVSQDDWVDSTLLAAADSLDVPMCFNIAASYMTTAAKRARVVEAWASGHDIGVHSGSVDIDTLTAAEITAMYDTNDAMIRNILSNNGGGPLSATWTPDSWVFHGNRWTSSALETAMARYNTVRLQMEDTSNNLAYPYLPSGGLGNASLDTATTYKTRGRGLPMVMANRARMMLQYSCDACNEARDDTTGNGAFLSDLVAMHGIAEVMCHPIIGTPDLSKREFTDLIAKAIARGDIWITTPRKTWSTAWFQTILSRSVTDSLYIATTAGTMGGGTWADPAHIQWGWNYTWNRPVKCKTNEVYYLDTLVTNSVDLVPIGNSTFIGPSTIKSHLDNGGSGDVSDAATVMIKCTPGADSRTDDPGHAGTYPPGYPQKFSNLTFQSQGCTNYSSSPATQIQIKGKRVLFEDCTFNIRSRFAINGMSGGSALRLKNCTFNGDTAVTGTGAIILMHASDSLFSATGCTFNTATGSAAHNMIYREVAPSATKGDTLANCIWRNQGSNTTSNAWRSLAASSATKPYYNVYWGGNLMRSTAAQALKIQLKSGAKTWAVGNDSLMDKRISLHAAGADSLKSYIVTYDPAAGDTIKWGGLPLGSEYGTATYWGSIGPTQYTGGPLVWGGNYAGRETYQDMPPWTLLALVNAGVLPSVTAANVATYYEIPRVYDESAATMVETWLDAWRVWPSATRDKIQYRFSDTTALIKSADSTYVGPAQLIASLNAGNETACDSTLASTWFTLTRPYNLTDKLQIQHWLDYMEVQTDTTRRKFRFKVADTDLGFYSPATDSTYANGLWALYAAIGGAETASDSTVADRWFCLPRERPAAYAQGVQNRIYTRALAIWPDTKRKQVRVRTK